MYRSSIFFRVDQYFDFITFNAENGTLYKMYSTKWQKYVWGHFKNHWEFFPNPEPDFSEQFLFVKLK